MDVEHRVLDIDDVTADELQFQELELQVDEGEFDHALADDEKIDFSQEPKKPSSFTAFPQPRDSDEDVGDKEELLRGEKKQPSFWTFEYYQAWFDVDTYQVLRRIQGSMVPRPRYNYLRQQIRPNPDLYGPFWICTTLVFTTAICGNLANYISCGRSDYEWKYDFHKVTFAAAAIFCYWWLIPAAIYGLLWWRGSQAGYTFMEIICVYGYSLAIYIPISILWVVPFQWFQWTLVAVGMLLSGCVLLFTFWPAVREDDKKIAWITMGLILFFHGLLATGFMLYFFHVPISSCPSNVHPTLPGVPTTILATTLKPQKLKDKQANDLANLNQNIKSPGAIAGDGGVSTGGANLVKAKSGTGVHVGSPPKKLVNAQSPAVKRRQTMNIDKGIERKHRK
ncbi:protein YIPF1-like isoform X2 [Lineus longissimus]|uniref:protein YIPF1-like isoform X2 n=1 Tax=Lineus longissimus TaxID=88925 RepID=UPI00315D17D4